MNLLIVTLLLALLGHAPNASAETIRVVSWNLQPKVAAASTTNTQAAASSTESTPIEAAAEALKKLEPDVILLQGVRDWQMCIELAQALKPADYNVAICSTFQRVAAADADPLEVAILAKHKAYFSWSEPWHAPEGVKLPGGYAFAAFQAGERRLGVFSTEMEPQLPALTAQQILDQIDAVKHWETNQVQAYVIGCTFNTFSKSAAPVQRKLFHFLGTAGFEDAFVDAPSARNSTIERRVAPAGRVADFILVDAAGFSSHPAVLPISVSDHHPVACEVEIEPGRVATARAARTELARGGEPPSVSEPETNLQAQSASTPAAAVPYFNIAEAARWVGAGLAGVLVIVALSWFLRRRRPVRPVRTPALLPRNETDGRAANSGYTVVIAPRSVTASIADQKAASQPKPVIQIEAPGQTQTQSGFWQQRALAAEEQAKRTQELLRQGLVSQLSQWLKQKLVRKLIVDRAQLLEAQEAAARKALNVDERLNRIEQQIRQQNQAYERRIEELNRQLLAAKEESRELIRARIVQVKAEMEAARARLLARAQEVG